LAWARLAESRYTNAKNCANFLYKAINIIATGFLIIKIAIKYREIDVPKDPVFVTVGQQIQRHPHDTKTQI